MSDNCALIIEGTESEVIKALDEMMKINRNPF